MLDANGWQLLMEIWAQSWWGVGIRETTAYSPVQLGWLCIPFCKMLLALPLELVSHFIGDLVTMSIRERGKMFSGITEEHWFESVIYLIPGHLEHLWAQNRKLSCPTALSMFFLPLSHCAGMGLVETCREKHSAHLSFIYTHSPNNCPWLLLWPGVMHTGHEAVCP